MGEGRAPRTVAEFFAGAPDAAGPFAAIARAIDEIGPAEVRIGRSQIGFRRERPFAAAWVPGRYLRRPAAPLVLTVFLPERDPSPRWKQIVEPGPGRFTHHLELHRSADVDSEVVAWLRRAWEAAGQGSSRRPSAPAPPRCAAEDPST